MSLSTFASAVVVAVLSAELPLVVDRVTTGANSRVQITNSAKQPITAWALAITTHPAAAVTHREVWTVDGYMSEATHNLPGSVAQLERLVAGETRELQIEALPAGATVDVAAVVMDDGTTFGDEAIVGQIFERRARERDALQAVAAAFDVIAREHGIAAVAALRERLAALVQRDGSPPCQAAL